MKNNYILNLRKGQPSGYTFIKDCIYPNEFSASYNLGVQNTFIMLEECGYKLLNVGDYPNWFGIPVFNIFGRVILFQDIEFYNVFETKKNEILVRWYKIEKLGYIRMKQVLFTKPEHLQKPLNELVTAASMKNYNITISPDNYKMLKNVIVPYNIKGMLLINEFDKSLDMYLEDDFNYLSGELPIHLKTKKKVINQSFSDITNEDIRIFINYRPEILKWSPIVNTDIKFDAHYIKENTYYY